MENSSDILIVIPLLLLVSLVFRNGEYVIVNIRFFVFPAYFAQSTEMRIPQLAEIRAITIKYLTLVNEVSQEAEWKQLGRSLSEMAVLEEVILDFPMDEVRHPFEEIDVIASQLELTCPLRVFVDMELVLKA